VSNLSLVHAGHAHQTLIRLKVIMPSCPSLIIMQVERCGLDLLLLNGQGFTLKSC